MRAALGYELDLKVGRQCLVGTVLIPTGINNSLPCISSFPTKDSFTMAPIERSAVATATPETIWETCFTDMKWEKWDVDVKEVRENYA
jgi:hypothetical protein